MEPNYRPEPNPSEYITDYITQTAEPNQALEPTTFAVTFRAPSRTDRASQGRGSS